MHCNKICINFVDSVAQIYNFIRVYRTPNMHVSTDNSYTIPMYGVSIIFSSLAYIFIHAGTMHGALMSLIAIILAIFLISRELQYSLSVRTSTTLQVDSQFDPFGRRTNFTFSLQFPNIACRDVSVSAEDNNGNPQVKMLIV